ncbi:MAG: hypothetical protein NVS2B16_33260 [Chloroflexota bacterium]
MDGSTVMAAWLLLHYKLPNEPSGLRVTIWRKLKRLGALLLHDAVWILPATARTREQFQWLALDITEMGGEALLWEAQLFLPGQEATVIRRFQGQAEVGYRELLAELAGPTPDLGLLARHYHRVKVQDYFDSPLGEHVWTQLLAAREKG